MKTIFLASLSLLAACELSMAQGANRATAPRPNPPITSAWNIEDWNPHSDAEDYIIPLPCKGALALRKIVTGPAQGAERSGLDDRQVRLGWSGEQSGYIDFFRSDYVSGPFEDSARNERFYYIGKFEITRQQYYSVMDKCPPEGTAVDPDASLPATNVSWFDALQFTRILSNWLYANSTEYLPLSGNQRSYVRLPTEVEWEFAARGGLAVSDSQRSDKLFPIQGSIKDYAWHAGAESSDGRLNQIGALKPNPLKLYDILGNAEEMTLEPFRMNRLGRLHGQPGGFITKGGSYETSGGEIRTALRQEFPYFAQATKGENKRETFGFRIVLSSSVIGDLSRATALQRAWQNARQMRTAPEVDPARKLQRLAQDASDPETRTELENLQQAFSKELALRNEIEARVAKNLVMSAAVLRSRMQQSARLNDQFHKALGIASTLSTQSVADGPSRSEMLQKLQTSISTGKAEIVEYGAVFVDLVNQLAADFPRAVRQLQAEELDSELVRSGRSNLRPHVAAVVSAANEVNDNRVTESRAIIVKAIDGPRPWLD
jgi:formylglycine-generating enzyme required for sulfatase activity